jgi:Tol biopolymer transport system component/DNA-binding winged helix-turn-helix (wHTH) protein
MSKQAKHIYEFGPFRLDSAERLLLRGGAPVSLTPKVFDTLLVLIENSGHLVEKDELMTRLWPDTFVEEVTLARNVSDLRKALGQAANGQKYIETVPKRGYRFLAGVSEVCEEGVELIVQKATRSRLVIEEEETITKDEVEAEPALRITTNGRPSNAEYLIGKVKLHKLGALVSLAVLLGGVGALTYGIYRFAAPRGSYAHFQNLNKIKFTPLTTVGNAIDATVSPDGKLIAYVQRENGKYSLWTKAVATDSAVQIVPPAEALGMGKTKFSPDGNYIYYSVLETAGPEVIYQVKVLGGTPREVVTKVFDSTITFSPDGKQFAFLGDSGLTHLFVVNTDGTDERILASSSGNVSFSGGPSWSPDGKIIATPAYISGSTARQAILVGVAVESGEVKPLLSQQRWTNIARAEWFRDGSGLVLMATQKPADRFQLWQLSYPGGEVRRITNDLDDYGPVSLTTDSGVLVTTRARGSCRIWVVPDGDASKARQLTSRGGQAREGGAGVAWTPDGRIVYSSKASGGVYSNIWIMNADGSNPRQLTDAPVNDWFPAVSPDGRYIVFSSNRSGEFNLWRMDINGGNLKQLSNGLAFTPHFSPDGRWVACMFGSHEKMCIWKFPVDGNSPVQLTETNAAVPTFSWDGKLIAYDSYGEQVEKPKVVIVPSEGGARVKVLDYTPLWNSGLQWSPDDKSIIYVDLRQGGANLWRLPLDGGPAQQLTDFKSETIYSFEFTPDGRQLVCARGTTTSDVVMISESE